ncbi:hypothetical protein SE23_17090 [Vibrio sinaloensis]|uniref:hypothetical protein n=1 Tax=Photobacterium sp. (strain ATCC 43367) TaxID=379097 RepID=UPI00057DFB23|nr:hypothetical protein [Vibrio sinaloensis]KIE19434.1 hypothetical protein SE23_17090 [Vibrio sinaloensis]
MKAAKSALLLTLPALMVGCGGGSGGSSGSGGSTPSSPKYTINFVALKNANSGEANNCAVYGQNNDNSPTEFVIAAKASGNNMSIYIHEQNGELTSSYNNTDWSNGSFSFNQSLVPDNGYISVVATNSAGGLVGYDILTIEKSLIPKSFSVNAKGETYAGSCLRESTFNQPVEYTGHISTDGDAQDGWFAFHSTTEEISGPTNSPITFNSIANQEVLAARLCRSDITPNTCNAGELLKYKFTTTRSLGTASEPLELTEVDNSSLNWTPNADAAVDSVQLNVYRGGSGALLWQDLPNNASGKYSYASELRDEYFLAISGTHNNWDFSYTTQPDNIASELNESNTLTTLGVPATNNSALTLVGCSGYALDCVNGYTTTAPSELDYQRTLVVATSGANSASQTIYAKSRNNQPLMEFGNNIDSIWATNLDKVEISLLSSNNNSDVTTTFLSAFFDAHAVVTNNYVNETFTDTVSVISTSQQRNAAENALKHQEYKLFNHNL